MAMAHRQPNSNSNSTNQAGLSLSALTPLRLSFALSGCAWEARGRSETSFGAASPVPAPEGVQYKDLIDTERRSRVRWGEHKL